MADISIECPGCAQHLEAPEEMAGETCECPSCGQELSIPAVETVAAPQFRPGSGLQELMAQAQAAAAADAAASEGRTCRNCGAEMDEDSVLCLQCGFHEGLGRVIETQLS